MAGYTYIITNQTRGTLYVGVTSNLDRRIFEHRNDVGSHFTSRHKLHQLVWFEEHETIIGAITREKQLKAWKRDWKIQLIEKHNLYWSDLYPAIARP